MGDCINIRMEKVLLDMSDSSTLFCKVISRLLLLIMFYFTVDEA